MSAARAKGAKGDAQRNRELAAIHMGKKSLGWSDELYREVLIQLTEKASAKDLTGAERAFVLDFMRRKGFTREGLPDYDARQVRLAAADQKSLEYIRGLWDECYTAGALRDGSAQALRSFVRRMAKVQALEWLTTSQATVIIEALKAMRDRARGMPTA